MIMTKLNIPSEAAFEDADGFINAPDLAEIGQELIDDEANEIDMLTAFDIRYLWAEKATKRASKPLYATITRPGKLARHLSGGCDFVICAGADALREIEPTSDLMASILYHQLLHISLDSETGKPALRGPDVAFFHTEIKRRGLWTMELRAARMTMEQMPLPFAASMRRSA